MAALNSKAPSADAPEKALLFAQVQYHIVQGHGLSSEIAEGVSQRTNAASNSQLTLGNSLQ